MNEYQITEDVSQNDTARKALSETVNLYQHAIWRRRTHKKEIYLALYTRKKDEVVLLLREQIGSMGVRTVPLSYLHALEIIESLPFNGFGGMHQISGDDGLGIAYDNEYVVFSAGLQWPENEHIAGIALINYRALIYRR